jgi:hypothetical protein
LNSRVSIRVSDQALAGDLEGGSTPSGASIPGIGGLSMRTGRRTPSATTPWQSAVRSHADDTAGASTAAGCAHSAVNAHGRTHRGCTWRNEKRPSGTPRSPGAAAPPPRCSLLPGERAEPHRRRRQQHSDMARKRGLPGSRHRTVLPRKPGGPRPASGRRSEGRVQAVPCPSAVLQLGRRRSTAVRNLGRNGRGRIGPDPQETTPPGSGPAPGLTPKTENAVRVRELSAEGQGPRPTDGRRPSQLPQLAHRLVAAVPSTTKTSGRGPADALSSGVMRPGGCGESAGTSLL